jgi:hypothetical protein
LDYNSAFLLILPVGTLVITLLIGEQFPFSWGADAPQIPAAGKIPVTIMKCG